MTEPVKLRVIVGQNDIQSGIPETLNALVLEVKKQFGLKGDIALHYMDVDFGNEFVNLSSTSDVKDRATIKVIQLGSYNSDTSSDAPASRGSDDSSSIAPASRGSDDSSSIASIVSNETDDTVILSSSETTPPRTQRWPVIFPIPRFSHEAEIQLERANTAYKGHGTLLSVSPKLKSDILEKLSDDIFQYEAYPKDVDFCDVAEALIKKHPCLKEPGCPRGYIGWKTSLKYKMGNLRTRLRSIGCPEISFNSLKNKSEDEGQTAKNIKKTRKAEVNYCTSHPSGTTTESLEMERVALLNEVKKINNKALIKERMAQTFSYRRQEVVQEKPMIAQFKSRWPALFKVDESLYALPQSDCKPRSCDNWINTAQLLNAFKKKGGVAGRKIGDILAVLDQNDDIHTRRECLIKALCIHLKEDHEELIKEYLDVQGNEIEKDLEQTVMCIFVIRKEDAAAWETPEDVGIVIEGVEVVNELGNVATACAMLLGLIYALNLSYPKELKCTFEALQKLLMQLDCHKLSPKVQALQSKMYA